MCFRRRRLQVSLSFAVILLSLAYLLARVSPPEVVAAGKSELSECHFLLKHSYVEPVDGRLLLAAAARGLEPYLARREVEDVLALPELQALPRLEALVEKVGREEESLGREGATYLALEAMVEALDDPWTEAMRPKEFAGFQQSLRARSSGGTPSVRSQVVRLEEGRAIGWLKVEGLKRETVDELRVELESLHAAGVEGLVLDLRDNAGGYVDEALAVSSLFLESGLPVVKIVTRGETDVKATLATEPETLPLVVVVNGNTASSAEILAASLQEYGRARLVGEKTFGKGSVQSLHEFSSGGGLKFTVARYTTPHGRRIDGHGLEPDLALERIDILPFCRDYWKVASHP